MRKEEKGWRREVRDMIEKEIKKKLDCLMRTIESLREEKRKLILEKEELGKKLEKERMVKEIVEMNWKKLRREIVIEHRKDVTFESVMTRRVDEEKDDSASQDVSNEEGEEMEVDV